MPQAESIVLVEDDRGLRELLTEELESEGYRVIACRDTAGGQQALAGEPPDLLISDLRLPDASGLTLLPAARQLDPSPAVLIITAFGSVQQAVEALKAGADDFLTKPLEMDHFLLTVTRLLETRKLKGEVRQYRSLLAMEQFHGMFGQSPAMQQLFHQIRQIATADGPVLIQGESGTGKELVARALHEESARRGQPYLVVNCGGIPAELMESEFFGHAAGAFTGARNQRAGLFQQADGGTLLLDELGEMPLALQAKLLRVLQDGRVRPVGSDHEIQLNVRVLGATNRNLTEAVADGSFREDLFYRLETFTVQIPPLRGRGEDSLLLADFFLARFNARKRQTIRGFADDAVRALLNYAFPGNVRELQNAIERAATFCDGPVIEARHLPARIFEQPADPMGGLGPSPAASSVPVAEGDPAGMPSLESVQRQYIHQVLKATAGNKRKAADILGITRRTLYRWLE